MDSERDMAIRLIRLLPLEEVTNELERLNTLVQATEFIVGWHDYFLARLSLCGNMALWEIESCELKVGEDWVKGKLSRGNTIGELSYSLFDEAGIAYVVDFGATIRAVELKAKDKETIYE